MVVYWVEWRDIYSADKKEGFSAASKVVRLVVLWGDAMVVMRVGTKES